MHILTVVSSTNTKNLHLIVSGKVASNPSEILDSPQMEVLLVKAKKEYDYVIIDAPPIVAVTDAKYLLVR